MHDKSCMRVYTPPIEMKGLEGQESKVGEHANIQSARLQSDAVSVPS